MASPVVDEQPTTVEALVRARLSRALGGRRGMLESAVPTICFTATWVSSHHLRLALGVSGAAAAILLLVRLL